MRQRLVMTAAMLMLLGAMPTTAAGQGVIPKTPWGAPDLQGIWDFNTLTPLERPSEFEEREFLTEEEASQMVQTVLESEGWDARYSDPQQDVEGAYNQFWTDRITNLSADRRTSLIVKPRDGQLPALTAAAYEREQAWRATWQRPIRAPVLLAALFGINPARGPEDFGLSERCLVGYSSGPPINGGTYNSNLQIFQTRGHVVLYTEMIHEARVVPLDGRPHVSPAIRQWLGDARGHWDGDTLVVESVNFTPKRASFYPNATDAVGSGEALHLTERFSRVDIETLRYEYTVDDPVTFTSPFTVSLTMQRSTGPIFEYACHEGNYGLLNALAGARAQERVVNNFVSR